MEIVDHISSKVATPYVLLTYAQSLDGTIGAASERLMLSGARSMALTHGLRRACDAVCVGIGTVLADDPRLTVRDGAPIATQPAAVVFDTAARTPLTSNLVRSARQRRVIVVAARDSAQLRDAGVEVLVVPAVNGQLELDAAMKALHDRGFNKIMIEGGARIIKNVLQRRLAHDLLVTIAPVFVGAINPLAGGGGPFPRLTAVRHFLLDDDVVIYGPLS